MRITIVGAGIFGLGHAWAAARHGHQVTVLERTARAEGASIRNFGMVWPIGQPPGEKLAIAMRSRELWLEFIAGSGIYHTSTGSVHLVTQPDEMAVLEEFASQARELGYCGRMLTRKEAAESTPAAQADKVCGGFFSPTEVGVDPPNALQGLANWLSETQGVTIKWKQTVVEVGDGWARTADRTRIESDLVIICGGQDLETLLPEVYVNSGIRRCKLQMLSTQPQPGGWKLGPMVASGLTLRHYEAFARCPSLPALRARVTQEAPELDRFGIHVMAAQHATGELILGDSHEYDDAISPFEREEIEALILRELQKFLTFPDWSISRRWQGIYAKHPTQMQFEAHPMPKVYVFTAPGGSGMTMSFGLADKFWNSL